MFTKNQYGGDCLEKVLGQFVDLREGLGKKEGVVFEGVGDAPIYTMLYIYIYFVNIFFLLFINKNVFFTFSLLYCDEISNIWNRILTSQKPE